MKSEIHFSVDLTNPEQVQAAINMLSKFTTATEVATVIKTKKETVKTVKATDPENLSGSEPLMPKPEAAKEVAQTNTSTGAVKLETLQALLPKKIGAHRDTLKAKLTEFGAKSVSTLEPQHFQAMYDFMNGLA